MNRALLVLAGTRPEIVKLAPVIAELKRFQIPTCIGVSGQHRELLAQALGAFDLKADFDLRAMKSCQSLSGQTASLIGSIDGLIAETQPAAVLVQGDTTTALSGALASSYHRIAVGHVEAGLRTGTRFSPFPEEVNRRLIAQLATWHFAPTPRARAALISEGVSPDSIYLTGNTIVEIVRDVASKLSGAPPELPEKIKSFAPSQKFVLITGHRRENMGSRLEAVCDAIAQLSAERPDVAFVYALHLNPAAREPVERILGTRARVILLEPLAYQPFIWLLMNARGVVTDSGGVQEEALTLGTKMLVTRESTERPEVLTTDLARLSGPASSDVAEGLRWLLDDRRISHSDFANPLGDGNASRRIASILAEALSATDC